MTRLRLLLILPAIVNFALADDNMYRSLGSIADQIAAAAREKAKQPYNASPIAYPQLLLAEPFAVTRLSLADSTRRLIVRESYVTGLDYHLARGRLYWADRPTGRLLSTALDPRTRQAAYEVDLVYELDPTEWRPQALAVDHVADKIYVADSRGRRVHVLELDGSRRAVLLEGELKEALDIAVDPQEGLLFVADGTGIVRSNTDGTEARVIIGHERYHIKSLALDLERKRVYWSDESYHRIKRADYDGSGYAVVLRNEGPETGHQRQNSSNDGGPPMNLGSPASLALGRDRLYFHDDVQRRIALVELDPASGLALVGPSQRRIYEGLDVRAMRLLDPSRQPAGLGNPCPGADAPGGGGGCRGLCLIGPGGAGFSCVCEAGRVPSEGSESCISTRL